MAQQAVCLASNRPDVGLNTIKVSRCFIEQETLPTQLSTGQFEERIRAFVKTKTAFPFCFDQNQLFQSQCDNQVRYNFFKFNLLINFVSMEMLTIMIQHSCVTYLKIN